MARDDVDWEVVEQIHTGDEPEGIRLAELRTNLPVAWKEPRWEPSQETVSPLEPTSAISLKRSVRHAEGGLFNLSWPLRWTTRRSKR